MGEVIAVTIIVVCWLISLVVAHNLGKCDGWTEALEWSEKTIARSMLEAQQISEDSNDD